VIRGLDVRGGVRVTTLPRNFRSAELAWSPSSAARELDQFMSRLPTSLLETLLKLNNGPRRTR
jgi:hypothetical protein